MFLLLKWLKRLTKVTWKLLIYLGLDEMELDLLNCSKWNSKQQNSISIEFNDYTSIFL